MLVGASDVHGASAWATLQAAVDVCFGRLAPQLTGHLAGRRACICVGGFGRCWWVRAIDFDGAAVLDTMETTDNDGLRW